jgi:hypothetical protein
MVTGELVLKSQFLQQQNTIYISCIMQNILYHIHTHVLTDLFKPSNQFTDNIIGTVCTKALINGIGYSLTHDCCQAVGCCRLWKFQ